MTIRSTVRLTLVAVVALLAGHAGFAASDTPPATPASPTTAAKPAVAKEGVFTIINKTTWDISAVHVTPAEEDTWTANLLKHKLAAGGTAKMRVECDETDVKLVDAHGHTCISESMYPCGKHSTWTVTNQELAGCKTFGQ